jgi:hypothetical protein
MAISDRVNDGNWTVELPAVATGRDRTADSEGNDRKGSKVGHNSNGPPALAITRAVASVSCGVT